MARSRKRNQTTVSLFPFLSVLACVIGTLTLLIAATAIGRIASDAVDIEEYENLEDEIVRGRRQLAELTAITEEIQTLDAQIDSAKDEQSELTKDAGRARKILEREAPKRRTLAQNEDRARELEAALERARLKLDALVERERAMATAPILIQPSGSGYGLEPHFAECRRNGLVIYEGIERHRTEIATHRIDTSAEYRRFLRTVRLREGATVVFLIRPGGVPACDRAAVQARAVRSGSIPLPGDGELDFSLLGGG